MFFIYVLCFMLKLYILNNSNLINNMIQIRYLFGRIEKLNHDVENPAHKSASKNSAKTPFVQDEGEKYIEKCVLCMY